MKCKKNFHSMFSKCKIEYVIGLIFFILVIISIICFCWKFWDTKISDDMNDWGNYSMCIGALFTFISLIFIYKTYISQKDSAYTAQIDLTFFQLLGIQRDIYTQCNSKTFVKIKNEIISMPSYKKDPLLSINERYESATQKTQQQQHDIMYYFRHLYHIINYIDKSKLSPEDKKSYIDILQAQMSDEELASMVCNVIHYESQHTKPFKYIDILDSYNFFENLRSIIPIVDQGIINKFPRSTFKYIGKFSSASTNKDAQS